MPKCIVKEIHGGYDEWGKNEATSFKGVIEFCINTLVFCFGQKLPVTLSGYGYTYSQILITYKTSFDRKTVVFRD